MEDKFLYAFKIEILRYAPFPPDDFTAWDEAR
jgi:hypothetical protein